MSPKLTSREVRAIVASYLRFERGYPLVCFEADNQDIIAVTADRQEIWVEVKVSISDMRADAKKRLHRIMLARRNGTWQEPRYYLQQWPRGIPQRFYFAVPDSIREKAQALRDFEYPYAGLIQVFPPSKFSRLWGHSAHVVLTADRLHSEKATIRRVHDLVIAQSASLANLAAHYARAQRQAPRELAAIPDSTRRRLAHLGVDETEFRKVVEHEAES